MIRAFRIETHTGKCDEVALEGAGADGALVWVHFGLDDVLARLDELKSIGLPNCPPVFFEVVARWHAPDEPFFDRDEFLHWDKEGKRVNSTSGPRMVKGFALGTSVPIGIEGEVGIERFQMVMLASAQWLLTTMVPPALDLDELREAVLSNWTTDTTSGGDLGMRILRSLSDTYHPALRVLRARLQLIEQAFVQGSRDPENVEGLDPTGYIAWLLDLKKAVDHLSVTLPPLRRPGENPHEAWFDANGAKDSANVFAARLDDASAEIADLRQSISNSLALASSANSTLLLASAAETLDVTKEIHERESERAEAAAAAGERTRQLQNSVTFLTAALLGPGLVAATWGALPSIFDGCQVMRAVSLIGAMAIAFVLAFFLLNRRHSS